MMNCIQKHLEKPVYLLFFLSGACGLVYEVIWGKYLSLFIGNTTHAHMIVLATFMGGLAAGSFVFGRIADRFPPLKLYAWLEIGIGCYGIFYSPIVEFAKDVYFSTAAGLEVGGFAHLSAKLLLAFLTLIVPTFLMGGTLPALSRFFVRSLGNVGTRVALLYFINSFGAVVGTIIAGFYVVEQLGLIVGLLTTGGINVVLGLLILVMDKLIEKRPVGEDPLPQTADNKQILYAPHIVKIAMVGIWLSGFTSMIYELVWFRIFAVVLESSTYSFSLMLAAFITGITIGSLIVGRIMKHTNRVFFWFGISELGIVVAVILTYPFYERLPYYFWTIRYMLNPIPETFVYYNIAKFLLCFSIMLVPTLFFGMTLPLVSNIAGTNIGQIAKKIGNVYAVNTIGTLMGALCAGLILIPLVGLAHSLEIAFVLNFSIAFVVLLKTTDTPKKIWKQAPLIGAAFMLAIYIFLLPSWNNAHFALGVFRNRSAPPPSFEAFAKSPIFDFDLLYYKEDLSANVAVTRHALPDDQIQLSLAVNGKVDATSVGDIPTQILLAQLPLMLQEKSEDVLLIGMGSGMTAGAALTHPLNSLDCIEISQGVAEAAQLFSPYNHNVVENPNFKLIVEDAKTYINTTSKRYDVVISEPSNPWMAGVGNLFSIEFFGDAERILKPNGLVVQWFHRYEISNEVVASAVRTFRQIYPYTYIFQGNTWDMILVGSRTRLAPNFDLMAEKMMIPSVKEELGRIHIQSVPGLLALQSISPEHISRITSNGFINSEYRPVIEYQAPRAFYLNTSADAVNVYDERLTLGKNLLITDYLKSRALSVEQYRQLIDIFRDKSMVREVLAFPLIAKYLELNPDDRAMRRVFAEISLKRNNFPESIDLHKSILDETDANSLEQYANLLYRSQKAYHSAFTPQTFEETYRYLKQSLALTPDFENSLISLGQVSMFIGRYDEALAHFLRVEQIRSQKIEPISNDKKSQLDILLGIAYYHLKRYDQAQSHLEAILIENSKHTMATHYYLMIDIARQLTELETRVQ